MTSSLFFKEISLVELGVINIEVGSLYIFLLYVLVVLLVGLILVFIRFKRAKVFKGANETLSFASCMIIMAGIIYSFAMTKGLTLRLDNLFLFLTATIAYRITKNECLIFHW